jgi:hypothetical protein
MWGALVLGLVVAIIIDRDVDTTTGIVSTTASTMVMGIDIITAIGNFHIPIGHLLTGMGRTSTVGTITLRHVLLVITTVIVVGVVGDGSVRSFGLLI